MITIETQVHGYQQGHQLLSSSTVLSKPDQSIIDRLSDVAGPLRPGEKFSPYLSAYPLPSGRFYILARTWQDANVPRAGCVRTLSLLIPSEAWASASNLSEFLDLLDPRIFPSLAKPTVVSGGPRSVLPPTDGFRASELLEALFLEETKPVALFDAPAPELIAVRLLTALWPSLRSSFALSTLALSPRKIEGRNFDLVFAPKDARSKFADWPGRRIDAQARSAPRHRWTNTIVDRVFEDPQPWLLDDRELRLFGTDEASARAALRIALLWEELIANLEQSPAAALGLLDIAASRMQGDPEVVRALQPAFAEAAHRAVATLPAREAWELLAAMAKKMHGSGLQAAAPAVADAAAVLASKSPSGAIGLLDQANAHPAIDALAPRIAHGLNRDFVGATEGAIAEARPETLAGLLTADDGLAQTILTRPALVARVAEAMPQWSAATFAGVRDAILKYVVDDAQLAIAQPLLESLEAEALVAEVRHLARVSGLAAESFFPPIVARARELGSIERIRSVALELVSSPERNRLVRATLRPVSEDITWLLGEPAIPKDFAETLLVDLLRGASSEEFRTIFLSEALTYSVISRVPIAEKDIFARVLGDVTLPITLHLELLMRLLPALSKTEKAKVAQDALDRALVQRFQGDEIAAIVMLLGELGSQLDGVRTVRRGIMKSLPVGIVSRNLSAFNESPKAARTRIVGAFGEIAQGLSEHYVLELDNRGASACAEMLWDARSLNGKTLLRAAGVLLPVLLRSRRSPVSPIIAAVFPVIYRELAKEDEAQEMLRFVPFFAWDRCKSARRELVDAFMAAPSWAPGDLALTACRSEDVGKILRRAAKAYGGEDYIGRVSDDLSRLPDACRTKARRTIRDINSDWSAKYSWRD